MDFNGKEKIKDEITKHLEKLVENHEKKLEEKDKLLHEFKKKKEEIQCININGCHKYGKSVNEIVPSWK